MEQTDLQQNEEENSKQDDKKNSDKAEPRQKDKDQHEPTESKKDNSKPKRKPKDYKVKAEQKADPEPIPWDQPRSPPKDKSKDPKVCLQDEAAEEKQQDENQPEKPCSHKENNSPDDKAKLGRIQSAKWQDKLRELEESKGVDIDALQQLKLQLEEKDRIISDLQKNDSQIEIIQSKRQRKSSRLSQIRESLCLSMHSCV